VIEPSDPCGMNRLRAESVTGGNDGEGGGLGRQAAKCPRAGDAARGRLTSVLRVPDQGEDVGVGLSGGPAEIGVERLGPEFWGRDREGDILLA